MQSCVVIPQLQKTQPNMRSQTSQKAELFARAFRMIVLGVFAVFVSVLFATGVSLLSSPITDAATSNTINFQARLETGSGSIAPDGSYNVSFHLFKASAATGGTSTDTACGTDTSCEWAEQYTYSSGAGGTDARVRVVNGYLTVNLGSLTAFSGINWNQQQWLTMDIGGTAGSGTITWDGQMNPRLLMTAVPYAFQASGLSVTNGSNTNSLVMATPASASHTITVPDENGTICTTAGAAACTAIYAPASGGGGYIQNSTSLQSAANFNVQSAADTSVTAVLRARSSQTSDLMEFQNSTGGTVYSGVLASGTIYSNGVFSESTTVAGTYIGQASSTQRLMFATGNNIQTWELDDNSGVLRIFKPSIIPALAISSTGATLLQNATDATNGFEVQGATGTHLLDVDTQHGRVGVGTNTPGYTFDVVGGGNFSSYVLTPVVDTASATALTLGNTNANAINIGNTTNNILTTISGTARVQTITNSAAAFQVQNANGTALFGVDTTAPSSLLTNPGFETNISGWTASGTGASIVRNTTASNTYEGIGSLTVTLGSGPSTGAAITNAGYNGASIAAGTYTFGFYAKGSATLSGLAVSGFNGGTCTLNTTTVPTTGFQHFFCTITTTGATTGNIILTVTTASQTMYIDGAQLVSGSALSPFGYGTLQLRGTVTTPLALQNTTNSTTALQVQNASSGSILDVDTLNGFVGVGTSTPATNLDVQNASGNNTGTYALQVKQFNANSFGAYIFANSNSSTIDALNVQGWNGSSVINGLDVKANGRVGIGTTSPDVNLVVASSSSAGAPQIGIKNTATGGSEWYLGSTDNGNSAGGGKFIIGNTTTSTAAALTINSSSQVGIGTTSPASTLTVNGSTLAATWTTNLHNAFQVQDVSTNAWFTLSTSDDTLINNATSDPGNLLENGGFESLIVSTDPGTGASGWFILPQGSIVNNSTNAHTGNQYLSITANGSTLDTETPKMYRVTPGDTIYAEGWVNTVSATGTGGYWVRFLDKSKATLSWNSVGGAYLTAPASWTRVSGTLTVPANAAYMTMAASVRSGATGTWLFDDAGLQKINSNSPAIVDPTVNTTTAFQVQNASNSTILDVDATNGRVGIGTTSPADTLDVESGNIRIGSSGYFYAANGSTGTKVLLNGPADWIGLQADASNVFSIADKNVNDNTLGAPVMSFLLSGAGTGGKIGINTTAPNQLLTINGNGALWNGGQVYLYDDSGATQRGYVGGGRNGDLAVVSKEGGKELRIGSSANIGFWMDGNADSTDSPGIIFANKPETLNTGWNGANSLSYFGKYSTSGRSINAAGSINSNGGDYAEYLYQQVPNLLQKGDLVTLSSSGKAEEGVAGHQIVGVVSTQAGFVGNDLYNPNDPGATALVGLMGQIPTKVSTENGDIAIGDALAVSPDKPGVAVKQNGSGAIVGYALESYANSNTSAIGTAMVLVRPGWSASGSDMGQLSSLTSSVNALQSQVDSLSAQINSLTGQIPYLSQPNTFNGTSANQMVIQDASGNVLFTADTQHMVVTVANLTVAGTLTVNGHIVSTGNTPTVTAGSAACTAPTVSVAGTDTTGTIIITTGTQCANPGQLAAITFNQAYTAAPQVILTAANSAAALLPIYRTTSTTGFTLSTANKSTSATTYIFSYFTAQ